MNLHTLFLQSFFANIIKDVTEISFANLFGLIAIVLKVVEFQLKNRNTRITLAIGGNICWLFYFFLKGSYASTISSVIAMSSNIVFMMREKHKWANSVWWLYLFIALTIVNCIVGFADWIDIFAISAGFFGVIAYYSLNDKVYRYLAFVSLVAWLLNSIFRQYGIALANDAFATLSVLIAILRLYVFKKPKDKITKEN